VGTVVLGVVLVVLGVLLKFYDPFLDDSQELREAADSGERPAWVLRLQATLWDYTWLVIFVVGVAALVLVALP
jgi:quinol-cytochrome oxidoreductase complex cytochrome b subunit